MKPKTPQEWMDLSKADAKQALDTVMARFDFDKAAAALNGCGWAWINEGGPTLDADGLRVMARDIAMRCIESGSGSRIQHGPMVARCYHYDSPQVVTVDLDLCPVSSAAVFIDCRAYLADKLKAMAYRKPRTSKGVSRG